MAIHGVMTPRRSAWLQRRRKQGAASSVVPASAAAGSCCHLIVLDTAAIDAEHLGFVVPRPPAKPLAPIIAEPPIALREIGGISKAMGGHGFGCADRAVVAGAPLRVVP
jgi:hypothetical protein